LVFKQGDGPHDRDGMEPSRFMGLTPVTEKHLLEV
jgi:hypothetical protein